MAAPMPPPLRTVLFLWFALGAVACVRAGFEEQRQDADGAADVAVGDLLPVDDQLEDRDRPTADGAKPDYIVGPLGPLTCSAPQEVGSDAAKHISEAALRGDGLELVARGGGVGQYKPDSGNIGELWVSERASTTAPFPKPRPLTDVNSTSVEGSAHLAPWKLAGTGKVGYELFFSSERKTGSYLIFRSVCTR
jgi:hypothetical protein